MDAGAGVLISRGLMEKVPLDFMHKCIFDIKRAHGKPSKSKPSAFANAGSPLSASHMTQSSI